MTTFNKVYSVSVNVGKYLLLQTTVLDQILDKDNDNIYVFDGIVKGNKWRKPTIEWMIISGEENDGLIKPDIAGWGATILAVSEDTANILKYCLKDCCELLPLTLNGENWFALHIIGKQHAIDDELTIRNMKNGRPSRTRRFEKLVLKKSEIKTNGLFRVEGVGLTTYCTDEKGGFYDKVQTEKLSGLVFKEVNLS